MLQSLKLMKRDKKITFAIISIAAVIILIFLFLLTLTIKPSAPTKRPPFATGPITPIPTSSVAPKTTSLEIAQVIPDFGQSNLLRIDQPIIVIFNKAINPEAFTYELTPSTIVETELDSTATRFKIRGNPFWPNEQAFTFTIKAQTQAQDGSKLKNDYIFNFKTGIPEEI